MKPNLEFVFLLAFLFPVNFLIAQVDSTFSNEPFKYEVSIAGGQFEATTLIFTSEIGVLLDADFFKKHSALDYAFGTRICFESYSYFEPGGPTGGPFKDYSLLIYNSSRTDMVHVNFMGGIAYQLAIHMLAGHLNFYRG